MESVVLQLEVRQQFNVQESIVLMNLQLKKVFKNSLDVA